MVKLLLKDSFLYNKIELYQLLFLFVLLIRMTITDLESLLIYNHDIVLGLIAALIFKVLQLKLNHSHQSFLVGMKGAILSTIPFLILYSFGLIGDGDVKLSFLIGFFLGWRPSLLIITFSLPFLFLTALYLQKLTPYAPFVLVFYTVVMVYYLKQFQLQIK